MTAKYWWPGNTDLDNDASYSTNPYTFSATTKPTTGDTLAILRGGDAITGGDLDVQLAGLEIGSQFYGSIGSAGASIVVRCDSGTVKIGSTPASINIAGNGTNAIAALEYNGPDGGNVNLTAGTVTRIARRSGRLNVGANCTVVTFHGGAGSTEFDEHGTAVTTLVQTSIGRTISRRNITTGTVSEKGVVETWEDVTVGTLNCHATWNHRSSGTITAANVMAGVLTNHGALTSATITTLSQFGGMVEEAGAIAFTIGTPQDYMNLGIQQNPVSKFARLLR